MNIVQLNTISLNSASLNVATPTYYNKKDSSSNAPNGYEVLMASDGILEAVDGILYTIKE